MLTVDSEWLKRYILIVFQAATVLVTVGIVSGKSIEKTVANKN